MRKLVALVAMVMFAASLSATVASPAHATFPGRNGRIVFEGCDDVSCQIYTVNPDGSALRQVTDDDTFNLVPDWSPDGTHIVYSKFTAGRNHLHIMSADGSNDHQLTPDDPNAGELWPHFMPDGKTIVFTQFAEDGGISSIRPDGTHKRAIVPIPTNGESYNDAIPSPNGERLAFNLFGRRGILVGVYVSKADGSHQRLVSPPRLEGWSPDWNPHGRKLVFSSNNDRPNSAIYSVHANGADVEEITHPAFPFDDITPSYSPRGDRIAFASDRRYPDLCCTDLFVMSSDGSGRHRIPLPPSLTFIYGPKWGSAPLLSGPSDPIRTGRSDDSGTRGEAMRKACAAIRDPARSNLCGAVR